VTHDSYDLMELIYETKAVSIWSRTTGPVYWYAASVPGPFYVNTELLIGPATAHDLLEKITSLILGTPRSKERAQQLDEHLLTTYKKSLPYQKIIKILAAQSHKDFPVQSFDVISGGERRDWLFSIPLAHELNIPHLYLFKNNQFYCTQSLLPQTKALHVADLINNAASYFDSWFPILAKAHIDCIGTLCVNTRGTVGLNRLHDYGQKVSALNKIDASFFQSSQQKNLISQETVDEIAVYFESPTRWAEQYLMKSVDLFDIPHLDKKSFERLQTFFNKDPWQLRPKHQMFFSDVERLIKERNV